MIYSSCPHYQEIVRVLASTGNPDDADIKLDDVQQCPICASDKEVCELWINLSLVTNLKPQLGLSEAKLKIENLHHEIKEIAHELIKIFQTNNNDDKFK